MKKFETMSHGDRAGAVALASTAELVEWYNAHVEPQNQIKKFSDRKTAERRILAMLADKPREVDHSAIKPVNIVKTTKVSRATKNADAPADRSAAVALTWMNPDVAAARAVRDHVLVDGAWHVSLQQAFYDLNIPLSGFGKFRAQLKRKRKLEAFGKTWVLTKADKENFK